MLKIKKLNPKGFGHHFLMAIIVLLIGVGGAYTLVKSHADDVTSTAGGGPVGCVAQTFTTADETVVSDQPCVKYAQVMLNYEITSGALKKYDSSTALLTVDGEYGPLTQAAVTAFQQLSKPTDGAGGMLGQYTWAKLCSYVGQAAPTSGPSDTTLTYRNGFVGANCVTANTTQVSAPSWVSTTQPASTQASSVPPKSGGSGGGSGVGSSPATNSAPKSGGSGGGGGSQPPATPPKSKTKVNNPPVVAPDPTVVTTKSTSLGYDGTKQTTIHFYACVEKTSSKHWIVQGLAVMSPSVKNASGYSFGLLTSTSLTNPYTNNEYTTDIWGKYVSPLSARSSLSVNPAVRNYIAPNLYTPSKYPLTAASDGSGSNDTAGELSPC